VASTFHEQVVRQAAAYRSWEERKRQVRLEAPMTTRCARCSWSHTGTVQDGVGLARNHRREAHAGELPERATKRGITAERRAYFDKVKQRNQQKVLGALHAAERPMRVRELMQATDLSVSRTRTALREVEEAVEVRRGLWWLADRELPPEPGREKPARGSVRGLREGSIAWQAEERRRAVLGAVERLRSCGVVGATAEEIGAEAGLGRIATGKVLGKLGFERVERNRHANGRAVWVLEQGA